MSDENLNEIRSNDVMAIFRREKRVGPATPAFLRWCQEQNLPQPLRDHFRTCSILGSGTAFGPGGYLFGEESIIQAAEERPEFADAGFLHLGHCPNSDFVVMDLTKESLPIGFLSHELIWSTPTPAPRTCFVHVASDLYEFVQGWEAGSLPCDYYGAK